MTTEPGGRVSDADLMAYLDHSLHATRAAEVEAALDMDPDARSRLAEWQHQNALIAGLYRPAGTEPLPDRLNVRRMSAERQVSRQSWQRMAAAAVICLAVGGASGWYFGHPGGDAGGSALPNPMEDALAAHQLYADDIAHPVAVSGNPSGELGIWLSKRLDRKLVVPNLETAGWTLVGGTLLPEGGKPGAQIMYEDSGGRRLTLFFTPIASQKESAPRFAQAGDLDVMGWTDGSLDCIIIGPIGRQDIKRIASDVYEQTS